MPTMQPMETIQAGPPPLTTHKPTTATTEEGKVTLGGDLHTQTPTQTQTQAEAEADLSLFAMVVAELAISSETVLLPLPETLKGSMRAGDSPTLKTKPIYHKPTPPGAPMARGLGLQKEPTAWPLPNQPKRHQEESHSQTWLGLPIEWAKWPYQ